MLALTLHELTGVTPLLSDVEGVGVVLGVAESVGTAVSDVDVDLVTVLEAEPLSDDTALNDDDRLARTDPETKALDDDDGLVLTDFECAADADASGLTLAVIDAEADL